MEKISIQRDIASSRQVTGGKASTEAGNWRGMSLTVQPGQDIDEKIAIDRIRRTQGQLGIAVAKSLSDQGVRADVKGIRVSASQLSLLAQNFGGKPAALKTAARFLEHFASGRAKTTQNESLDGVMKDYVALKLLVDAAKAGPDDFIARMTPLAEGNSNLSELADKLKEANDDPHKLQQLLAGAEGLPDDAEELFSMMKTLRFNPKELGDVLRRKQGFPDLNREQLADIADRAEDLLREMEVSHGSRIKAARNAIQNGAKAPDPGAFAETYVETLHGSPSFMQMLQGIVNRHPPADIPSTLLLLKQTLADEIRLDQEDRSLDKIKLEAVNTELSHVHISSTLLEKLRKLTGGFGRMFFDIAASVELNERQLLSSLLKVLSAGWISPSHFERLAVDLGIPDGGPRIYLLTGILQVVRELPFKVFEDDSSRLAIIEAIQSALDTAIDREEAVIAELAQTPGSETSVSERIQ
jgi:type III secretion system TyeA family effector delivery regulator